MAILLESPKTCQGTNTLAYWEHQLFTKKIKSCEYSLIRAS
jgi:hypothetical protein